MREVLAIDCCIRGAESRTAGLLDAFLAALPEDCTVTRLVLTEEALQPLTGDYFEARQRLLEEKALDHPRFRYAHQFADADIIVLAAPFWDLGFPALLKIYIEQVSVDGITFHATDNRLEGLCRATDMIFLTTRGGSYGEGSGAEELEMGSRYLDALHTFFGAGRYHLVAADGIDIVGADVGGILRKAKEEAEALAKEI